MVTGSSIRAIATRYNVSTASLWRHWPHIANYAAKAIVKQEIKDGQGILATLEGHMEKVQKLMNACDEYLQDPENPGKYDLGPRAGDITVIYNEDVDLGDGKVKRERRKKRLSQLLEQADLDTWDIQFKIADPRELVLKAAIAAKTQLNLIADILGVVKREGGVTNNLQVNIFDTLPVVRAVLERYPKVLAEVQAAFISNGNGNGNGSHA